MAATCTTLTLTSTASEDDDDEEDEGEDDSAFSTLTPTGILSPCAKPRLWTWTETVRGPPPQREEQEPRTLVSEVSMGSGNRDVIGFPGKTLLKKLFLKDNTQRARYCVQVLVRVDLEDSLRRGLRPPGVVQDGCQPVVDAGAAPHRQRWRQAAR